MYFIAAYLTQTLHNKLHNGLLALIKALVYPSFCQMVPYMKSDSFLGQIAVLSLSCLCCHLGLFRHQP